MPKCFASQNTLLKEAIGLSICKSPRTKLRRKWKPTPVFLPGESQGWGSLVGCCLWSHRVRHDWSDLAAGVSKNKEYLNWENPNGCNVNLPLYEASTWILTMNESGRSGSLVSTRTSKLIAGTFGYKDTNILDYREKGKDLLKKPVNQYLSYTL